MIEPVFTPTETEKSLYKAILADPDNDIPRLMLADELISNSTPSDPPGGRAHFASFIMTQVEWSKTPECHLCLDTGVMLDPLPGLASHQFRSGGLREVCRCSASGATQKRKAHLQLKFDANSLLSAFGSLWFPGRFHLEGFDSQVVSPAWIHYSAGESLRRLSVPERPRLRVRRGFPHEVSHFRVEDWLSRPGGPVPPGPNPCHEVALGAPGLGAVLLSQCPTLSRAVPADVLDVYEFRGREVGLGWAWPPHLLSSIGLPSRLNKTFSSPSDAADAMSEYLISEARNFLSRHPNVLSFDAPGPFVGVDISAAA